MGAAKCKPLLKRQGWDVGRDQTERPMRLASAQGVKQSKRGFTTDSNSAAAMPADLVRRRSTAPEPRRLWVAEVTYLATWSGFAYVAFVTDVESRRKVAATLKAGSITPLKGTQPSARWKGR